MLTLHLQGNNAKEITPPMIRELQMKPSLAKRQTKNIRFHYSHPLNK